MITSPKRRLVVESDGARRMNHDVMTRGAFSNVQLKNQMVPKAEGGIMPYAPSELTSDDPARAA